MGVGERTAFDMEIDDLLSKAEGKIPGEIMSDLPYMKSAPDVHEWHDFEHQIWNIGEEIRQLVSTNRKTFHENQINRIIGVCLDKRAKRGRQSFIMLLGAKKYSAYAPKLISLLGDEDVNGQVIDTLYRMQAKNYTDMIIPFLNHNRTWIRNAAKKYVQKFK